LRHVIGRIRARWPRVEILVRGDSHYGRIEAMTWCERKGIGYIFGLAGNKVLLRKIADLAEDVAVRRVEGEAEKVRRHGEIESRISQMSSNFLVRLRRICNDDQRVWSDWSRADGTPSG